MHDLLLEDGISLLPIRYEDILAVERLDHHHADPFDRILIAQAINHSLALLTHDAQIRRYAIKTVW